MPEIIRTRDTIVHFKGDTFPVRVSPSLLQSGWRGSQGVMWDSSPQDEFRVTTADGSYCGFLLFGSDEPSDQYTALTGQQIYYGFSV